MGRWKAGLLRRDAQLSRKTDELAQLNADLDRKVAERTSELELEVTAHSLAEAQAELFFTRALDMKFLTTLDFHIARMNPAAEQVLGFSADEMIGRHISEFVHPDDLAKTLEGVCGVAANRDLTSFEIRIRCKDGTYKWISWSATAFQTQNLMYAAGRDITERKRTESQVRLQAAALESAGNAIVIADRDGSITWVNPAFTRLTGYAAEEAIGQNPRLLKSGQHDEAFYRQMWQTLSSGKVWRGELVNKRKDGTVYNEEMTITPVCADGKILHFVAIKQEITERIRHQKELAEAREAAEAANRAKSDFLARMSHEIRTPMNGVIGMTELALDTKLNPEQREYLETVKKSADTLLAVINDILDFSKIEAHKLELESIPFRLRDTLDDMVATLGVRAQQKGLELACDVQTDVPDALVGDPGRLRQILINLVGNAIKFTRTGEVIVRVALQSASETAARLQFSVRDTGVGIAPEKLESIFQPFEQADGTITRRYGGTGLGLAIATQLVELMGGTLNVESNLGKGSTFMFTSELQMGDLAAPPTQGSVRALPVLVVDDNETNRRILEKALGNWGMQVTTADGGAAALTAMQWAVSTQHPFRLALVDSQMPIMDGFSLIAELRKNPITSSLPVIMLTSAGQSGDAARCREFGVAAYLTKPIRQSQLLETILAVLGTRETQAAPQPLSTHRSLRTQKRNLHILLAEDNPINQKVAQRVLEKWGHTVRTASDGREALNLLESQLFDVVLMDVEMPELDGLQATAALREREQGTGRHVPIVAMTAHAMKGDRERCLAAGMDGYVSKPFRADDLHDILENVVTQDSPDAAAPHAPQPRPAASAFDRDRALHYFSGSEELLCEIAGVFIEHTPQLLAEIDASITARDAKKMERAAHTLRGSVSIFGADAATAAALQLEELGRAGSVENAKAISAALETEVNQLCMELSDFSAVNSQLDATPVRHS
jgi:PAS domain S-box-containing protein